MTILDNAPLSPTQRIEWFVHDRFGMFIHWGLYSLAARHEWVKNRERMTDEDYQRYFDHFDPDLYDPASWARLAKRAGMRYAVLTTKHHDGFCLWDSALTEYKVTNTPAGRDLLREWVEAFRAAGLKIGLYYSLLDWYHPEFPIDGLHPQRADLTLREQPRSMHKYAAYLHAQVRELLTNYGPIDIFWPDFSYTISDWGWSKGKGKDDWQAEELVALIRSLQPNILINNRLQWGADFATPEDIHPPAHPQELPWEASQTLNGSWGYHRDNHDYKTPEQITRLLIEAVSNGGNLLLNVGPNARGEIDAPSTQMLEALAVWMRLHARSIYGASSSPFHPPQHCYYTQRANHLYLHILSWPMRLLQLEGLAEHVEYAQLLHDGSEVGIHTSWNPGQHFGVEVTPGNILLELPLKKPDVLVPVVELFLKNPT